MGNKINDPIARLMGLRYKSHPWHGIEVGDNAPEIITAFIEMVPTDTVKYELDKVSGYLKIDRPQKYSNVMNFIKNFHRKTSLLIQWLRIYLPMQGTWVKSLVKELKSHIP